MMGSVVQTPCNKESRFMNTRLEVGQAMCLYHFRCQAWLAGWCLAASQTRRTVADAICCWTSVAVWPQLIAEGTALRRYDVRYELLRRTKAISHSLACDRYKQMANLELPIVTVLVQLCRLLRSKTKLTSPQKRCLASLANSMLSNSLIIPRWIPWHCTPPSRKRWWHCSGPQRKETTVVWDLPCGWAGELRSYTVEVVAWWWKTYFCIHRFH